MSRVNALLSLAPEFAQLKKPAKKIVSQPRHFSPSSVKQLRKKTGISQADLARYVGVEPSAVCQWESGKLNPSGPALRVLELIDQHGLDIFRCGN